MASISIFQRLIFQHKVVITKDVFHLACQKSDVNVIKLLVERAKSITDVEQGWILKMCWQTWLFGPDNDISTECLSSDSHLGEYMRDLYFKEYGQVYRPTSSNNYNRNPYETFSSLARAVLELQIRKKEYLDLYLALNIKLNWNKNAEMLVLSNKIHFDNPTQLKLAIKTAAEYSNTEILKFLNLQFPDITFDSDDLKEIFQAAVENANKEVLNLLLTIFNDLIQLQEDYVKTLYYSSNESTGLFLASKYPFLSDQDFLKEMLQNAIKDYDLAALEHHCHTIPKSGELDGKILQELLDLSVSVNFVEAVDFLIEHFIVLKNLQDTIVQYLFVKSMEHSGYYALKCLTRHFPYLRKSKEFIKCQVEVAIKAADSDKLSFFLQEFSFIRNQIHEFKDCDLVLIMNAIEKLTQPVTGQPIEETAIKVFKDNLDEVDSITCDHLLEKIPGISITLAAREGSLAMVNYFLANGTIIHDERDKEGNTALHKAAERGHDEIVDVILKHDRKVEYHNRRKETPLHKATQMGHLNIVEILILQKANVNATDRYDICPIHQAAKKGHDKVIELLIDHGAFVDAKDKNQEIPLHHAARRGHPKVIDLLLKHGSDKELKNKDKETAIEVAQRFRLEKFNTDRQKDYDAVIALLDSTTM